MSVCWVAIKEFSGHEENFMIDDKLAIHVLMKIGSPLEHILMKLNASTTTRLTIRTSFRSSI